MFCQFKRCYHIIQTNIHIQYSLYNSNTICAKFDLLRFYVMPSLRSAVLSVNDVATVWDVLG